MRVTLTLDADVISLLERVRRVCRARPKDVINEALRRGLRQMVTQPKRRPYRTPSTDLGRSLIGSLDNIGQVLEIAGDDPENPL